MLFFMLGAWLTVTLVTLPVLLAYAFPIVTTLGDTALLEELLAWTSACNLAVRLLFTS